VRRLPLFVLFLVASCASSNATVLEDLEEAARSNPDAASDALLARTDLPLVPFAGPLRQTVLPLQGTRIPTVMGRINGVEMPIVLDTGSDGVFLSGHAACATRLYLPKGRKEQFLSPGFDALYRRGVFESLELGGLEFGRGLASVAERESRSFGPGGTYAIVGCSVLGHFRITFDFSAREIQLVAHGRRARPGTLVAETRIDGGRYWLLVDSGASRIILEPWAAEELGLVTESEAERLRNKSETFGSVRHLDVRLERLNVAGGTFGDVDAGVVSTWEGVTAEDGIRPAGLLGLAGLGDRVWTIDFGTGSIRVEGG
jgi:hypothetical protein